MILKKQKDIDMFFKEIKNTLGLSLDLLQEMVRKGVPKEEILSHAKELEDLKKLEIIMSKALKELYSSNYESVNFNMNSGKAYSYKERISNVKERLGIV